MKHRLRKKDRIAVAGKKNNKAQYANYRSGRSRRKWGEHAKKD